MNDFARSFTGLHYIGQSHQHCLHACMERRQYVTGHILFKQYIFSPDLPTKPVLIISVAWGGGDGGGKSNYFSLLLFRPKPFFTHVLIVGGARRWISVESEECGRNSSSSCLIVTTNPVLLGTRCLG